MTSWRGTKAAMNALILAVALCSLRVHSEKVAHYSKKIDYTHKIVTKTHSIHKTSLLYATCHRDQVERPHEQTAKCNIQLKSNVYNSGSSDPSCTLTFSTSYKNGAIEVLELYLWAKNRAIFVWRDINKDNPRRGKVTVNTVHMRSCEARTHVLNVDNRNDMKPQIFIVPSANTYDISFMDKDVCGTTFCKMTVGAYGETIELARWFPNPGLVHALEPIVDHANRILITIAEAFQESGLVRFYLIEETGNTLLESFEYSEYLSWSSSNGIISFCTHADCVQFDYQGMKKGEKVFRLTNSLSEYAALYNLPNGEIVAMICDSMPNSNYRVIRIGNNERIEFSFDLTELKCSEKPSFMTTEFYMNGNKEYCLTVFYSVSEANEFPYNSRGQAKFNTYCFLLH